MKDMRIYTGRATELMNSGKKIVMRIMLPNGNVAERIFTPIKLTDNKHYMYTHKMNMYDVKDSKLVLQYSTSMPSTTSEKGVLSTLLETLLISGYEVYDAS